MPYANPEVKRQRDAEYRTARRAELAAKQQAYYQRTRFVRDQRSAEWFRQHPEIRRAITFANRGNQRARELGISEILFGRDVKLLVGACVYCGTECTGWDHIIPLSRGGRNHISNLVSCCLSCNKSKGRRLLAQWPGRPGVWRPRDRDEIAGVLG